ncbi:MAG: hypothetical protein ACKOI0_06275 [Actinomycetota bacterium]
MRRRLPAHLDAPYAAFAATLLAIGRAKDALLASVPTTRIAGRPLAASLVDLEVALAEAAATMDGWHHEDVDAAAARGLAERVRLEAEMPEGFEALVGTIGDLLAPLDAFEEAEERFRALRRWRRR